MQSTAVYESEIVRECFTYGEVRVVIFHISTGNTQKSWEVYSESQLLRVTLVLSEQRGIETVHVTVQLHLV